MRPVECLKRAILADKNLKSLQEEYLDKVKGPPYFKRRKKYWDEMRYYLTKMRKLNGPKLRLWEYVLMNRVQHELGYQVWLPVDWEQEDVEVYISSLEKMQGFTLHAITRTDNIIIPGDRILTFSLANRD